MQEKQEVTRDPRRVGVKEDLIKFRPSPNFKNMKKFLKNRSDYTETASTSTVSVAEPAVQQKMENQVEVKPTVFQPPLPTYPPPDSPPDLNITIKKETEDEDENKEEQEAAEQNLNFEEMMSVSEKPKEENGRPKKTMCKEWVRGDCKRTMCKYSHELDLTQLRGVYTFCWNYQNATCTHPYCKFVHATIFEEAEFYRTGLLPNHALGHLKKPLPPPPPPEENKVGVPPNNVMNPMPNIHNEQTMPLISCVPASSIGAKPESYLAKSSPPLKHVWANINEFSSLPRDLDHNEHFAKKCKNCDIMEFRTQYKKEKVEEVIQSKEETNKEINILDKKCEKLATVLLTILKPASLDNNAKIGNGNVFGDKDKSFMEQFDYINRSFASNDSLKNNYGSNINLQALLNKFLCMNGDPSSLLTDVTRES